MQNIEENPSQSIPTLSGKSSNKLNQLLYIINNKDPIRAELYWALITLNSLLTLFIYLSIEQIKLIPTLFRIQGNLVIIGVFASIGVILVEFVIGLLYGKQLYIKGQFLLFRNVILPIGFYCIMNYTPIATDTPQVVVGLVVTASVMIVFVLQWLIGKEEYAKNLIIEDGLPLNGYLLIFEVALYLYALGNQKDKRLAIIFMIAISVFTKFVIINQNNRRSKCLQYTLLRIQSNLSLLYTGLLITQQITYLGGEQKQSYSFMFPLIIFIIITEFLAGYANIINPITAEFFNSSRDGKNFLEYAQHIADDLYRIANNDNEDVTTTCLIPIYYEHINLCKTLNCPLSHEFEPQIADSNAHYKFLYNAVFKITEQLFLNLLEVLYENIQLRIGLLNFYARFGSNRYKVLQLIAETETFPLSWSQKNQIYFLKRFVSDIDIDQFQETIKIQDSYQGFNHSISTLMRLLIEFWSQFLEERVDFQKVLQLSDKITPVMTSVEEQMQRALQVQTFSTIRIMKKYSEYAGQIINDEMKSATISDYTNLLSKKLSEVHELNSINIDMEIGLVAISLNVKKLGEIKIANTQAANIFNYSKQEFLNANVNNIMPSLIARHHDDFLKVFLVHQNKKVNTDRRPLIGRTRQNFLFEIFLQLQKSVMTCTEQLIFIANIELAKKTEASILIICDDKGLITDMNSTYFELFEKSYKKNKNKDKHFSNIQQLIPNFFEIALNDISQSKKSVECYDNPTFGIIQIEFQITKMSFGQVPDLGYIIKGRRSHQIKEPFVSNLCLTQDLVEKSEERELKGGKITYSSNQNQYHFSDAVDIYHCGQFHSEYTIPYMKLDLLGGILNQSYQLKQQKHYDTDIKTLRYLGDHFERVEEIQSFESEISEQEKAATNINRFSIMKSQLENENNKISNKLPQLMNILILLTHLIILITFYVSVSGNKKDVFDRTISLSQAYEFRSKISEYVLYFQAQDDPTFGDFFKQSKNKLKSELINKINDAQLPQVQKQKALKIAYLQETLKTTTFKDLINNQSLLISKDTDPMPGDRFLLFKFLFAVAACLNLLFNFIILKWHQNKIISIFTMFLGLTEGEIKIVHRKCVQFLKNSSESVEKQSQTPHFIEENEQENPHVKIKRFKNISLGRQYQNFVKLNVFIIIFFIFFGAMLINDYNTSAEFQNDLKSFNFISTVMPEYSTALMKIYSEKKQKLNLTVQESFVQKYQAIDFQVIKSNPQSEFLEILFSNQCKNNQYNLPNSLKCQQICNSVMTDGVSKAINLLSLQMTKIRASSSTSTSQLSELSILLYHLVQPKLISIRQAIQEELVAEYSLINICITLYFIVMLTIAASDAFYQHYYPLAEIQHNIIHSQILVNLIPDLKKKKTKNGYTQI